MSDQGLYKDILLQHYRQPHNKSEGELQGADVVRRGANPRCGDEIELGLYLDGARLRQVRFRGRGCAVCIASTSMLTDAVAGHTTAEARRLCEQLQRWFAPGEDADSEAPPPDLEPLSAVRGYPARRRCVLLAWEALADALDAL